MKPKYRFAILPKYPVRQVMAGDWAGLEKGTGYEFWGLRKFVPGDSYGRIDWKARARSGELYVREYLKDSAYTLMLLVDLSPSMAFGKKLSLAVDIAESLACAALQNSNPCGVLFFADRVLDYQAPSVASRQLQLIAAVLRQARTVPCRETRLQPAIDYLVKRLPACLGVIISDFQGRAGGLATLLEASAGGRYPAHEIVALHVLEKIEQRLEDVRDGQLQVRDMESGAIHDLDLGQWRQYNRAMDRRRRLKIRQLADAGIDSAVIVVDRDNVQEKVNTLFAKRLAARV